VLAWEDVKALDIVYGRCECYVELAAGSVNRTSKELTLP